MFLQEHFKILISGRYLHEINPDNADIVFASANPPRRTKIYLTR